ALAKIGSIDKRATYEDVRGDERAEAGIRRGDDVVVLRERGRRQTRLPGEDLEVPRASRVTDFGRDEIEHVAGGRVTRERRLVLRALDGWRLSGLIDDVEDDVALGHELRLLDGVRGHGGAFVLDDLMVVVAR